MKLAQKGLQRELELSKSLHSKHIPVLISPKFLRERGCGQVDIAYYTGREIKLTEVKHRDSCGLSWKQRTRLKNSVELVCKFFTSPVVLEVKN